MQGLRASHTTLVFILRATEVSSGKLRMRSGCCAVGERQRLGCWRQQVKHIYSEVELKDLVSVSGRGERQREASAQDPDRQTRGDIVRPPRTEGK